MIGDDRGPAEIESDHRQGIQLQRAETIERDVERNAALTTPGCSGAREKHPRFNVIVTCPWLCGQDRESADSAEVRRIARYEIARPVPWRRRRLGSVEDLHLEHRRARRLSMPFASTRAAVSIRRGDRDLDHGGDAGRELIARRF